MAYWQTGGVQREEGFQDIFVMLIAGLEKLTLLDYPGKVSATVFTVGCNFRCGFCHNPELVDARQIKNLSLIKEKNIFDFLKKRKGFLDGVCVTGGEPTLQKDLPEFIKKIKKMGYLVKLDTNGYQPKILTNLLEDNLLDFVAMDIKTSPQKYQQAVGKKIDVQKIFKSVELIKNSEINYEFRMTVVPKLAKLEDIKKISQWLDSVKSFVFQQFRNDKVLSPAYKKVKPYSEDQLEEFVAVAKEHFEKVELRGV